MEHDQTVCPRCGEPIAGYGFCQPCRSHIDSLKAAATPTVAAASDPTYAAAQVLREVARLEQALAATSQGISDRIAARTSAGAVNLQAAPDASEEATQDAVEMPKLPGSADERAGQAPRDVARLEDVLTVAPKALVPASVPPPAPAKEPAPPERPAEATEPPVSRNPIYVAAQALRESFWFEQAAAFKPAVDGEAPATEAAPPSVAPSPAPAEPVAEVVPEIDPLVAETPAAQAPEHHWLGALCLIALIAFMVVLTGRTPRRSGAANA